MNRYQRDQRKKDRRAAKQTRARQRFPEPRPGRGGGPSRPRCVHCGGEREELTCEQTKQTPAGVEAHARFDRDHGDKPHRHLWCRRGCGDVTVWFPPPEPEP